MFINKPLKVLVLISVLTSGILFLVVGHCIFMFVTKSWLLVEYKGQFNEGKLPRFNDPNDMLERWFNNEIAKALKQAMHD